MTRSDGSDSVIAAKIRRLRRQIEYDKGLRASGSRRSWSKDWRIADSRIKEAEAEIRRLEGWRP